MKLGAREIASFRAPYIIAELAANHNGSVDLARQMIAQAKEAGCDCVKFQSWSKTSLWARAFYQNDPSLEKTIDQYALSEIQLRELAEYARRVGIDVSSSVFSQREVEFLVDVVRPPFIKIASMDANNYPFLQYVAAKGVPIVLSTGLASLAEIDRAVATVERAGNRDIVLLHCVANYPPQDHNVNLNNIDMLRANYPAYAIGFSDHTIGTAIPLAAVAKGACVIEKHFTLDKAMEGWDHKVSATKSEMRNIVEGARRIVSALGSYQRFVTDDDRKMMPVLRRSIVAARPIPSGKVIERADLDLKRPGTGLEPETMDLVIGRVARRSIAEDELLSSEDF